jgi:hypothetical protein
VVALTLGLNPALAALVTSGQTSAIALAAFVIAWFAFSRKRAWAAGLALGLLWYKPTLAAGVVALLLVTSEWRILAGFAMAAILHLALGWMWAGTPVVLAYLRVLAGIVADGGIPASQPEHLHSLLGFWRLLLGPGMPSTVLWIVSAGLVVEYARRAWHLGRGDWSIPIALLCLVAVLLAPHLYVYDLVLLAPALLTLWTWSERRAGLPGVRTLQWLVGLAAVAPLSDAIAAATSVQLSTCVLTALVLQFARVLSALQAPAGAVPSD